jgi:hypothetical protein
MRGRHSYGSTVTITALTLSSVISMAAEPETLPHPDSHRTSGIVGGRNWLPSASVADSVLQFTIRPRVHIRGSLANANFRWFRSESRTVQIAFISAKKRRPPSPKALRRKQGVDHA